MVRTKPSPRKRTIGWTRALHCAYWLPGFLQALDSYDGRGRKLTKYAIQLLVYTFIRPGELHGARWEEISFEEKLWRIPAHRMKMKTEHLVPLFSQAIELLEQLQGITGRYPLIFSSGKSREDCMSDNTMRRAIFKLGYDGKRARQKQMHAPRLSRQCHKHTERSGIQPRCRRKANGPHGMQQGSSSLHSPRPLPG
jgi:integrase